MARRHAIFVEENFRIPQDAFSFEGFQGWVDSGEFPDTGRIDYLGGDVEVDMSPEDLYTHAAPKMAIGSKLHVLIAEAELGSVFTDSTRLASRFAALSVEPDVLVVLYDSLATGKVRLSPAARRKGPGRFSGLEGATDLVVEIVSDGSVKKDTQRLPPLYAQAGVPELWVVDARNEDLQFEIYSLHNGRYDTIQPGMDGWIRSPRLGRSFRLIRVQQKHLGTCFYRLEDRES